MTESLDPSTQTPLYTLTYPTTTPASPRVTSMSLHVLAGVVEDEVGNKNLRSRMYTLKLVADAANITAREAKAEEARV